MKFLVQYQLQLLVIIGLFLSLLFSYDTRPQQQILEYNCKPVYRNRDISFYDIKDVVNSELETKNFRQDVTLPDQIFGADYILNEEEADELYLGCDLGKIRFINL